MARTSRARTISSAEHELQATLPHLHGFAHGSKMMGKRPARSIRKLPGGALEAPNTRKTVLRLRLRIEEFVRGKAA